MRILVVQDADWTKKGPHQQHHLIEQLTLKGHEALIIGFDQLWDGKGFLSKKEKVKDVARIYEGAKVTFIRPSFIKIKFLDYLSFLFSSRIEINKAIKEFAPDIVIGFTSVISNYWGMYYAKKNKIPFIYYWTDVIHELIPFKPFRPIAKAIEKNIIKNSSSILSINEVLKDQVINLGAQESLTKIIPGGIDFSRFDPSKFVFQEIRNTYSISESDKLLFFMGWIYEFSGLKEIILELAKIKNFNTSIKVMIVGEGDAYLELKEIVKENKLDNIVIMTGQMPYNDIPKLIYSADICLLPAYNNEIMRDIVPIKMYEYLAMNKPVVSTKLPGIIKEFGIDHGVLYVDKPEDVITKVMSLNEEEYVTNVEMTKKFISNYDWNKITRKFEVVLNSLIEQN